jgi:hypothetical protein
MEHALSTQQSQGQEHHFVVEIRMKLCFVFWNLGPFAVIIIKERELRLPMAVVHAKTQVWLLSKSADVEEIEIDRIYEWILFMFRC